MPDKIKAKIKAEVDPNNRIREPLASAPSAISLRVASKPRHPLLMLQKHLGNRAVAQWIQTKLRVGAVDDEYEREAERVAEQVMRMPEQPESEGHRSILGAVPTYHTPTFPMLWQGRMAVRRQPLAPAAPPFEAIETEDEIEEVEPDLEEVLQTKSLGGGQGQLPPRLTDTLMHSKGRGQPLPRATRSFMEDRFGVDFNQVGIHTDQDAAWMNHALRARAFTYGHDIYFQAGEYHPNTHSGQRLLAHELVHVIQQTSPVIRRLHRTAHPDIHLKSNDLIQRSQALYFSTHGRQGYFRFAERFHREHGFPAPVRVSSVEEMLEHMVTLARPIDFVRIVTHAVPDGIFLPLLRGGRTSLYAQDMTLQNMASLERELAVEHPTVRQQGQLQVITQSHHIAPRDWVRQAWLEINWTRGGPDVLIEHILLLGDAPDPNRGPITDLEMHSFFWWILDRELLSNQPNLVAAQHRQTLQQTFNRNVEIFRGRLISTRWGTRESFARLEAMIVRVAPRIIQRALRGGGLNVQYSLPQARYESIQGAIERGTYPDNLLRAKFWIANGAELQIRGCRIGQNISWLETFRDFFGHGQGQSRSRPHVSAPMLRHAFGIRTRRRGRRRVTESVEWLQDGHNRIFPGNPAFEQNIAHVR